MPKTPQKLLLSLLATLAVASACAEPAAQEACPIPAQMSCPPGALTFETGIAEILHTRCFPCHAADGIERARSLTDYAHVSGERMSIASQLVTCSMPPAGEPPLSANERQQILDWFACGGPK